MPCGGFGDRVLSGYGIGTVAERCDLYGRHCDDSHSHWSYIFGFHEFDSRKETEGGRRSQKLISGKGKDDSPVPRFSDERHRETGDGTVKR